MEQQQQQQQNQETKADKIRALTAQGMEAREVAATLGVTLQTVYGVRTRDNKRRAKERARLRLAKKKLASVSVTPQDAPVTPTIQTVPTMPTVRISERTGLPVRKYTKRKTAKTPKKSLAERGAELRRLTEERRAEQPKIIEVPVPQPHYNLTWKQRLKALFTGRV